MKSLSLVPKTDIFIYFNVVINLGLFFACSAPDSKAKLEAQVDISKSMYFEYIIDKNERDTLYKFKIEMDSVKAINFILSGTIKIQGLVSRYYRQSQGQTLNKIGMSFKVGDNYDRYDTSFNSNESIVIRKGYDTKSSAAGMSGEFILLYDSASNFLNNSLKDKHRFEELFNFYKKNSGRKEIEFISIEVSNSKFSINILSD